MKTNLQKLAETYGVEAFPFGEAMEADTLELVLRASGVPEVELQEALAADNAS